DKTREFFDMAIETIVSDKEHKNNLDRLDKLKEAVPALKDCDPEKFDTQLTGANLVLLNAAWNLWCFKKIHDFAHEASGYFDESLDKNQAVKGYIYTVSYYRDISGYQGAGIPSGTLAMAQQFVKSITKSRELPDISNELVQTFVYLFDGVIESYSKDLKRLKLIN